jgi:hypothetical protein
LDFHNADSDFSASIGFVYGESAGLASVYAMDSVQSGFICNGWHLLDSGGLDSDQNAVNVRYGRHRENCFAVQLLAFGSMVVLVGSPCVYGNGSHRWFNGIQAHRRLGMKCLMQLVLGEKWDELPVALKAHYQTGEYRDTGRLSIAYPRLLQPYLSLMRVLGALVNRQGNDLPTEVEKYVENDREYWCRTILFPDGKEMNFTSFRVNGESGGFIEFVNAWLGLQMSASLENGEIICRGVRFVMKIGRWLLPIPEWMALGHTTIKEQSIGDDQFKMDFRMVHPLFGETFRYNGVFFARGK